MIKKACITFILCLLTAAPAAAHTLWVNVYESRAHKPGHVTTSLGFGHVVPMDDVFQYFDLDFYTLFDPAMSQTALPLPRPTELLQGNDQAKKSLAIKSGDLGVCKMTFQDDALKGTYQVAAASKENFYSTYIDNKGRKKWAHTTMDKIADARKVIRGMKFKANAKSFFAIGEWTAPNPLGFDLEILPKTDLVNLKAGDLVEFDIRLMGKPLNTVPEESMEYMTLTSNTFGGPDGFMLAARVYGGKAKFRIPTAGQWVGNVYTRQAITPDGPLKDLVGKCTTALFSATVSFNVKP